MLSSSGAVKGLVSARDSLLFHPAATKFLDRFVAHLRSNRIRSRGCTFDVSSPLISPWVKALIFWGFYEKPEVRFVKRYLPQDTDVIELGASIGVVTSHIAKKLGQARKIVSVEADPRLVPLIQRNVSLNAPGANVAVVHGAIDYSPDNPATVHLRFGDSNLSGGVAHGGSLSGTDVPTIRLSDLLTRHRVDRFALVSDIEGAEVGLIEGDPEALTKCSLLIIELHDTRQKGRDITINDQVAAITARGFHFIESKKAVYVFRR